MIHINLLQWNIRSVSREPTQNRQAKLQLMTLSELISRREIVWSLVMMSWKVEVNSISSKWQKHDFIDAMKLEDEKNDAIEIGHATYISLLMLVFLSKWQQRSLSVSHCWQYKSWMEGSISIPKMPNLVASLQSFPLGANFLGWTKSYVCGHTMIEIKHQPTCSECFLKKYM